eukprot:GHRQ01020741.1.p1 GENE.GHRQ01020741.1~~GHRQ01020741.1.p1  ORF type:complete len:209 (-),score=25.87 GHRQ01020741.1:673-1209(-)
MATERSYIMIKPDGVQRGLVGEVIKRFEQRGYKLVGLKMLNVERSLAEKHYADLSEKPFFGPLVDYIISGPVVAMVWEGKNIVLTGRKMIGATNPQASEPGTIRGDYAIEVGRNVIHGSDSVENAQKEIALWFGGEWRCLAACLLSHKACAYTICIQCISLSIACRTCAWWLARCCLS